MEMDEKCSRFEIGERFVAEAHLRLILAMSLWM